MPFKTLASLRKLSTLDAEVVAAAQYQPGKLLVMLTNSPVKLSAHMFSATTKGNVTNASLQSASDVALINKAVAIVQSGDDLWALLDIQHTPKIEQVGRDIQHFCACPKGETALAIGWDGQGAALQLMQNEVGGRQFVVRGELRACALDMDSTYVVANGAGGGQFRVHPGLTPESGAAGRADLPVGAKSFNKIKCGKDLSAIYKRGSSSVCIVRSTGSGYEAKMVNLDVAAVDVAVISTSLFTLHEDGRLCLFNGDTLQRANDQPMTPVSTIDVRASGRPTVVTTTSVGGHKLWIGTRSGDVMTCNAVTRGLDV